MNHIKILSGKHTKFIDIFCSKEGWFNWSRYKINNNSLTHIKGHPLSNNEYKFVKEQVCS